MKNMRYLLSQPGHSYMQYSQGFQMSIQSIHPYEKCIIFQLSNYFCSESTWICTSFHMNAFLKKKCPLSLPSPQFKISSIIHKTGKPFFLNCFVDISWLTIKKIFVHEIVDSLGTGYMSFLWVAAYRGTDQLSCHTHWNCWLFQLNCSGILKSSQVETSSQNITVLHINNFWYKFQCMFEAWFSSLKTQVR